MMGVRVFGLPRLLRAEAAGGIRRSVRIRRAKRLWLSLERAMRSLERWRMAR